MQNVLTVCVLAVSFVVSDDTWEAGPPAIKVGDAEVDSRAVIEKDSITLRNRGIAVSKKSFPKGATFQCFWKCTEGGDSGSSDADVLAVVFRTDGAQRERPYEIREGLVVKFQAHARRISLEHWKDGVKSPDILAEVNDIEMKKGVDHKIKIVDHAGKVDVYFEDFSTPILTKEYPKDLLRSDRVAAYNREPMGGLKVAVLSDVKISK